MTAHAVGSSSAVPATSKGAANAPTQGSAGAFEHQLHAARQLGGQEHAPAHRTDSRRGPDPGRDRQNDPSPMGPRMRQSDAGASKLDKHQGAASGKQAPTEAAAGKPQAATSGAAPALNAATPPTASMIADAASNEATPADPDADGSEQGAAALVGAMLALIGPATGKVLTSPAGVAGASGQPVAAHAGAPVLLQTADVAAMTVTTNMASTAMPAQLLAANGLSLDPKSLRESIRNDAAPTLTLSAPVPVTHTAPISVPVSAPAGSHAFAQELGQQLTWFVGQDVKQARIRLHPEELGSLDLKISMNHGRVDVVFHAQHPGAVTAVQQSLPQLDQMLAQHGLSLGNTEVGQHDRGDQPGTGGQGDNVSDIDEVHGTGVAMPVSQLGLLDAFA